MQYLIDQPVCLRIFSGHEIVAVRVARDAFDRLTRMTYQHLVQPFIQVQDFARLDFDVRRLAARAAERLMNHLACIRQRKTLALCTCC